MNDSHSPRSSYHPRDSRSKPSWRDRRPPAGRPRTAPKKNLFVNKSPEGSESWLSPWVELKYFTYNPAVFPRMLGSVSGEIAPGSLVHVYDKNGELFGSGFWNETSRTPLRMVYHGRDAFGERELDAALERAVKLRRDILRLDETTNAYRVLHGDSDGVGGLVVDRYADVLSLEVSTLAVWQRLGPPAAPPVRHQKARDSGGRWNRPHGGHPPGRRAGILRSRQAGEDCGKRHYV